MSKKILKKILDYVIEANYEVQITLDERATIDFRYVTQFNDVYTEFNGAGIIANPPLEGGNGYHFARIEIPK